MLTSNFDKLNSSSSGLQQASPMFCKEVSKYVVEIMQFWSLKFNSAMLLVLHERWLVENSTATLCDISTC